MDTWVKVAKSYKKIMSTARWTIINKNKGLDRREMCSLWTRGFHGCFNRLGDVKPLLGTLKLTEILEAKIWKFQYLGEN